MVQLDRKDQFLQSCFGLIQNEEFQKFKSRFKVNTHFKINQNLIVQMNNKQLLIQYTQFLSLLMKHPSH